MPRKKSRQFEVFGDGLLEICVTKDREIIAGRTEGPVRFGNRTVGVTRFYQAKVATDSISRMVAIPAGPEVRQVDLVIIGDTQYTISQIQDKFDAEPPCRYLSLKESPIRYKDVRTDGV